MEQFSTKKIRLAVFFSSLYLFSSLISNILSVKIVLLPTINMAVDAGTVLYPLTFVVRDMLHKSLGRVVAYFTVVFTGFLVAAMAIVFWFVSLLPPDPAWPGQLAFVATLVPVWRLVIASIFAEMVSNIINTSIFSFLYKLAPKRDMRASFVSNVVALLIDTSVFCLIAFAGLYDFAIIQQIAIVNLIFKGAIALVFTPLIRLVQQNVGLKDL
jgi:uncharacterized integral membrane protein (TIGR00697 family)